MQNDVFKFIERFNLKSSANIRYIDLTSEVGELGKELLLGSDYGEKPLIVTGKTKDEIGDCIFSLLALCCELSIDSEIALKDALIKYEKRFIKKGSIGNNLLKETNC